MPSHLTPNRFTTVGLTALPTTGSSYDVSDAAVPGLLLRVGPAGTKRWLFRFKLRGRTSRLKIGSFPLVGIADARESARKHRKEIESGIDPRRAPRPRSHRGSPISRKPESNQPTASLPAAAPNGVNTTAPTAVSIERPDPTDKHSIHFLVYEFVEYYVKPNREVPEEPIRILKKDVLAQWRTRDARTITSREITERLDQIVARGAPVMANRTAAILSQLFAFGVHRAILTMNPVSLLFMPGGKEKACKRALTEVEAYLFLHGAEAVCTARVRYHTLMVLLLTLIRIGSLAKARWTEFNFVKKEWRVPAEHDKERREHVVPLTDWAVEHVLALKTLSAGSVYVLPQRRKRKGDRPSSAQLISRSTFRLQGRFQAIGIASFSPHDIRRTGRTNMAMLGVDERIAERVLNHSEGEIKRTYDLWEYVPQKRTALESLSNYYAGLLRRDQPDPSADQLIRLWLSCRRRRGSRAGPLGVGNRPV